MRDCEKEHIGQTKNFIGCMPCLLLEWPNVWADYHHVVEGRKRLGHFFGFGMCLWHHRGELDTHFSHMTMQGVRERLGPSFAREKKQFIERFGKELMLVRLNDYAISLLQYQQWPEYFMPEEAAERIRAEHKKLIDHG